MNYILCSFRKIVLRERHTTAKQLVSRMGDSGSDVYQQLTLKSSAVAPLVPPLHSTRTSCPCRKTL